jgi:hypothetical protein
MHPSEWAKAIYQRKSRQRFVYVVAILLLTTLALWLAQFIKTGS